MHKVRIYIKTPLVILLFTKIKTGEARHPAPPFLKVLSAIKVQIMVFRTSLTTHHNKFNTYNEKELSVLTRMPSKRHCFVEQNFSYLHCNENNQEVFRGS